MNHSYPQALVTGAGQGIGRAVARRMLAENYEVWCFDQDQEALDNFRATLAGDLVDRAQ